jgi:hypothetical protein
MMMVFREDEPLPNAPLPQLIPWELIRAIAVIQLYIEERFIEPPITKKMPMSLLFHQTLSILASSGELSAARLAERVLSLPAFKGVSKEDYKALLVSMLNSDFVELTEEKEVDFRYMTCAKPELIEEGKIALAEGRTMTYDTALTCEIEEFEVNDRGIERNWKSPVLWRIHFKKTFSLYPLCKS